MPRAVRKQHRRGQPPRAQPRHEVDALDARQPAVDDEHVPVVDEATVQTRLSVANGRDGIPLLVEQLGEHLREVRVVLDEQQARTERRTRSWPDPSSPVS